MPEDRADAAFTLLLGLGVLGYLLAVTAHYVAQVSEESAVAARRALESQVAQREAELRALRAQIDPHFLFNSLNSVIGLIDADQARAKAMCLGLAEFLRDSLVLGREPRIALGREVGLARQYLGVEQVRFGRRLVVRSEVDDAAVACAVPPLILQPLVENAVRHGIATLLDGGEIAIEARVTGPRLFIEVTNPFDPDAPRRGMGFGLDIVRRRLAAIYGDAASLATASENARFRVAVTVPSGPAGEDTA
jgi:LytS/YehU family sensor histidine kinase